MACGSGTAPGVVGLGCCGPQITRKTVRQLIAHYYAEYFLAFDDSCRAFTKLTKTQVNLDAPTDDSPGFHINWTDVRRLQRRNLGASITITTVTGEVIGPVNERDLLAPPSGGPISGITAMTVSRTPTLVTINFTLGGVRYLQTWELGEEYSAAEMESDFQMLIGAADLNAFLAATPGGDQLDGITWGSGQIIHSTGQNLGMFQLAEYMGECGHTVDAAKQNRDCIVGGVPTVFPDNFPVVNGSGTYAMRRYCTKAEVRIPAPFCKLVFDLKADSSCPVGTWRFEGLFPIFICSSLPVCSLGTSGQVIIVDTSGSPYGYGELYVPACSSCNPAP